MDYKCFALISFFAGFVLSSILADRFLPLDAIAQSKPEPAGQISMAPDQDMIRILSSLKQFNFTVSFSRPPHPNAYGLMQPSTRKIWVHPVTYPLGIAKQTLIHEAVHAAQSCQSLSNDLMPIGIDVPISPLAHRHFMKYRNFRRHVEAEALTVQGLPNGADYVIQLLNEHC
jgi:hypothetical protein